jgi:hypothetical protein
LPVRCCKRLIGQKLLQHRRRQLAAATTAVRQAGQSQERDIHGAISPVIVFVVIAA